MKSVRLGPFCVLVVFLLWYAITEYSSVSSVLLPSPSAVLREIPNLLIEQQFYLDVAVSVWRISAGFVISAGVAIPIGLWMAQKRHFDEAVTPFFSFVRYLPVPALVPFTILWLGVGEIQKITIVFIGVFFQLVFLTSDEFKRTSEELIDLSKTLGLSHRAITWRVVLPANQSSIYDHLRTTLGWAWGWVMLAELVGATGGIGFVITKAQRFLLSEQMVVALMVVGLLGFTTDYTLKLLKPRLYPWA